MRMRSLVLRPCLPSRNPRGPGIISECGDDKRELAFFGDTMNRHGQTLRILQGDRSAARSVGRRA